MPKHCRKALSIAAGASLRKALINHDSEPLAPAGELSAVIDLRNKSFRKVSAEDYFLNVCPVSYDESAECPLWDAFLKLVQFRIARCGCTLKKLVDLTSVRAVLHLN